MEKAIKSLNKTCSGRATLPRKARVLAMAMGPIFAAVLLEPFAAPQAVAEDAVSFFQKIRSSVVLVRLQKQLSISESADGLRQVLLNGALVDTRFRPSIVKVIQSNGVAYDNSGHIVSYIGYRWLALNPRDAGVQIDLVRYDGFTSRARLVGVDQRAGIVILQAAPELPLQPRGLVRAAEEEFSQGLQKQPFYLVDLDAREAVRKVTLRNIAKRLPGLSAGAPRLVFAGELPVNQGQLVFAGDGSLLGFVHGNEPGVNSTPPDGVAVARQQLVDVDRIISSGQDVPAGWVGLYVEDLPAGTAGGKILVREVVHGSPAEVSGIRRGDLLLRVEGQELNEVQDFLRFVRWQEIGKQLQIQMRRGQTVGMRSVRVATRSDVPETGQSTLYLRVAPGREDSSAPQIELSEVQMVGRPVGEVSAMVAPPRLGIVGDDLTPQLGNFFGVEGGRGVLIISVAPGSLAERHGMRAGDVIVALNEDAVGNQLHFLGIIERHAGDAVWSIRLMRERKPMTVKIGLRPESPLK